MGALLSCFGNAETIEFTSGREVKIDALLGEGGIYRCKNALRVITLTGGNPPYSGFSFVYRVKDRAGNLFALVCLFHRTGYSVVLMTHLRLFFPSETAVDPVARTRKGDVSVLVWRFGYIDLITSSQRRRFKMRCERTRPCGIARMCCRWWITV